MKKITLLFSILFFAQFIKAQDSCITAVPFCTGTTYSFNMQPGIPAPAGPDYGCLNSQSSPLWFSVHITTSGSVHITGEGLDSADNAMDIDFIYWGPFTSLGGVCYSQLDGAHIAGCDYSTNNQIDVNITAGVAGTYYIAMVSNYAGIPANISYSQTGGTGEASCVVPCSFNSLTAVAGACDSTDNTYDVSGTMSFTSPPATGTLTVYGSCGGSQTFSAPFSSPTNYTFEGLHSNGSSCFVTALFSANPSCNINQVYTAPVICNPTLGIDALEAMNITIAPNPSNGIFDLSFNAASANVSIAITDLFGRAVYTEQQLKSAGNYRKQVDLTAFDKGIYFIRIGTEKGSITKKIIYN